MKTDSKEKDLFLKLCRYCAYRERAISEVREKMTALDINECLQKRLIEQLIAENFINEKRYAESFARGKFRNNRWGRLKISKALLAKQIQRQVAILHTSHFSLHQLNKRGFIFLVFYLR